MLFNSYEFIFGFLPVALAGFWILGQTSRERAFLWLTAVSLFFYAWWRPINGLLIAPSILINFGLARLLERHRESAPAFARAVLIAGIVFNLCFLGYFKYTMFLGQASNDLFGTNFVMTQIILPLGISFITFQKIAFLVDVHGGRVSGFSIREYALFVLFFPQLIAGPIVHFREMMPQFRAVSTRFDAENAAVGLSLFFMGLAKKLVLADPMGPIVAPLYARAANGEALGLAGGWIAALGFTLQIYFDFSGYSDMALGLARLFGIKLPANFNSPLKATSIVAFWQRWHISLTRFLTAYIYNPIALALTRARLAAGKPGFGGQDTTLGAFAVLLLFPTMVTMFVSGVWHGAGYTFIVWGLLHGTLIAIDHGWRVLRPRVWPGAKNHPRLMASSGFLLTFFSVVFAMALFRAPTLSAAVSIWADMTGQHGITLPEELLGRLGGFGPVLATLGVHPDPSAGPEMLEALPRLMVLLPIALFLPNTLQILARFEPAIGIKPARQEPFLVRHLRWTTSAPWAIGMAAIAAAGILSLGQMSEFLYWRF